MRRTAAVALVVFLSMLGASPSGAVQLIPPAGVDKDDAEIFKPTTDPGTFLSIYDSTTLGQSRFAIGYWQDYAYQALDARRVVNGREENISLVDHLSTFNLVGAIGLGRSFELGAHLPLYLTSLAGRQVGFDRLSGTDFNVGDIALDGKIDLLPDMRSEQGFGLAIVPTIGLPSGKRDEFAGTGKFSGGGLLVADFIAAPWRFAVNFGGMARPGAPNDLLKWGSAVSYALNERSSFIAEIYGLADAGSPFKEEFRSPVEMLGAFRFPAGPIDLTLGAGGGLNSGKNDPTFRFVLGITSPSAGRPEISRAGAEVDLSSSRKTYVVEDYDRNGQVSPGDVIVYTITIINTGTSSAKDLVVSDPIPPYTDFVPGSIEWNNQPVTDTDGWADSPSRVELHISSLSSQPGSNQTTIKFKAKIRSVPTVMAVRNEVQVSAAGVPAFNLPAVETTVFTTTAEREHVIETPAQVSSRTKLEITQNIQFDNNRATIRPESFTVLDEVVSVLKEKPAMKVTVVGHTDNVGSAAANLRLSKQRAEAVKTYLVSKGIAADRLEADGKGAAQPVASNLTAAGRATNRRVEFVVTQGNP